MGESFLDKIGQIFGRPNTEKAGHSSGSETFVLCDDGFPLVDEGATRYFNALTAARSSLPDLDVTLENLGDTGGNGGIRFKVTSENPAGALAQLKKKAQELRDEAEAGDKG